MKDSCSKITIIGNSVIKTLAREYDVYHIPIIQNILHRNGFPCFEIKKFKLYGNKKLTYEYEYVEGNHCQNFDIELLSATQKAISLIKHSTKMVENVKIVTFYQKIECYLKKLINHIPMHIEKNSTIYILMNEYMKLKSLYQCDTLIHGDLDINNILHIDNSNYMIIDFDESCMAPEHMDMVIFVIRYFKRIYNNNFTRDNVLQFFDYYSVDINLVKLYIIKVVLEKIYLIKKSIISTDDAQQNNDSYIQWLNIYFLVDELSL